MTPLGEAVSSARSELLQGKGLAMKSPFPGMDPFIEACGLWGDFHSHLIEKIYERLAEAVSPRYLVRTGERSYVVLVESEGKKSHPFLPDVSVTARRGRRKPTRKGGSAVAEIRTGTRNRNENGFCRPPVKNNRPASSTMFNPSSAAA